MNLLEAKALFEGDEHLVHVRVAEHDGNIYLDICNSDWQVVQVTPWLSDALWRLSTGGGVATRSDLLE